MQIGYPGDPSPKESPLQVVAKVLKSVHQPMEAKRSRECDQTAEPVAGDYDPEHEVQT